LCLKYHNCCTTRDIAFYLRYFIVKFTNLCLFSLFNTDIYPMFFCLIYALVLVVRRLISISLHKTSFFVNRYLTIIFSSCIWCLVIMSSFIVFARLIGVCFLRISYFKQVFRVYFHLSSMTKKRVVIRPCVSVHYDLCRLFMSHVQVWNYLQVPAIMAVFLLFAVCAVFWN